MSQPFEIIPNVLATRYASSQLRSLWAPVGKILLERELWIAVMRAQQAGGLAIPDDAITAYENAANQIDLDAIRQREAATRHDVKARLEAFNEAAGFEHAHKGMTSRDLTENVEQLQVYRSLLLLRDKSVALLDRFSKRAEDWSGLAITARTHNVPAQLTSLGKRMAMFGEEFLRGFERLEQLIDSYPARGIKGAVGTQLDMLTLLEDSPARVDRLEAAVAENLGMPRSWFSLGQVYPRSLDLEVVSVLNQLVAGPASFATTLRLMAGHELVDEGFAPGQTGSSAMPHKVNARSAERIHGFKVLLNGYLTMASGLSGQQWNEGDVSCSVVRRVVLPDSFFAADGLVETALTILDQMRVHHGMIEREVEAMLPYLLTTTVLMEAVRAGLGRETAHERIKHHALAAAQARRDGSEGGDLIRRLAEDDAIPLSQAELEKLMKAGKEKTGRADEQVEQFRRAVAAICERYPDRADYCPEPIL